jgi:hypothetical protein
MAVVANSDAFEQAWAHLEAAGLKGRVWVERPWMEPELTAMGVAAIPIERALREAQAFQARLHQVLLDWEAIEAAARPVLRHLARTLTPRWWRPVRPWGAADRQRARQRQAEVDRHQQELTGVLAALDAMIRGLTAAATHLEDLKAPAASSERQVALTQVRHRLQTARWGLEHLQATFLPWRERRAQEQRQWALCADLQRWAVAPPS